MSTSVPKSCDADTKANDLFDTLTAGVDFALPEIDFDAADFKIPPKEDNPLFDDVTKLTEGDLTERIPRGKGMFDGVMESISEHLKEEYKANRITGKEYASAYVSLTDSSLQNSVQFLLNKDLAHWQAVTAQMQARSAEIAAVTAAINNQTALAQLAAARIETNNAAATYALTKMKLASEDIAFCQAQAELEKTEYETSNLMPAQLGILMKQTDKASYEIDYMMPKELDRIQSQIEVDTAQVGSIMAQKDKTLYETTAILPAQKDGIEADTAGKDWQLLNMMPAQLVGVEEDNAGKIYTNTNLLPAQLESINEQTEAHRAKTLDTRLDGVTQVKGAIGKQKDLHQQQIDSYKRDAESKVVKMLLDTWVTQKSMDEGFPDFTEIKEDKLNSAVSGLRANLNLS